MRLFSRLLWDTQFLLVCLGSWSVLSYRVDAQESAASSNTVIVVENSNVAEFIEGEDTFQTVSHMERLLSNDNVPIKDKFSKCVASNTPVLVSPNETYACQRASWHILTNGQEGNGNDVGLDVEEVDNGLPARDDRIEVNEETDTSIDDELGILRLRSQPIGIDSELGVLRIRPTEDLPTETEPQPTRQNTVFLTGRASVFGGNNLFRTDVPIDDRIYQAGIGISAFPRIGDGTNLILSAEANLARYEDLSVVDFNELQFQAGIRQRLGRRTFGQLNWRHQNLSSPGGDSFFTANQAELLLSRRDILNNRIWLDTFYQSRLSFSNPEEFSRFTQIATGSLNYGFSVNTRASLLYQLFIDDYTEIQRNDIYHQILAQASHNLSSNTRLSLFAGFRFGNSSLSSVNFDDTVYGASINVNLPLF